MSSGNRLRLVRVLRICEKGLGHRAESYEQSNRKGGERGEEGKKGIWAHLLLVPERGWVSLALDEDFKFARCCHSFGKVGDDG